MRMQILCAAALLLLLLRSAAAVDSAGSSRGRPRSPKLDSLAPIGDAWRQRLLQTVEMMEADPAMRSELRRHEQKYQEALRASPATPFNFDCRLERSRFPPTSVHRLRPGDVNVIAAIGDSLTAANGALATRILQLYTEYRGYAWSIGGQVHLGQHITLANVLRNDNPDLYGFSIGNGAAGTNNARLNYAVPGAVSDDMKRQAEELVERMKTDRRVDFVQDWKIITLFVGGNDICNSCRDESAFNANKFVANVRAALDYLHANVPRAFVNVAEVLDISILPELIDGGAVCGILHGTMMCRCGAFPQGDQGVKELKRLVGQYQKGLRDLVDSGRYDTRQDFTVVNQPFLRDSKPPRVNGQYDQSFFAPDCFHFSQKGHAAAAKALWNNMLEPVGRKSTEWGLEKPLSCPTFLAPFLRTSQN